MQRASVEVHYREALGLVGRAGWQPAVAAAVAMGCLGYPEKPPPRDLLEAFATQVAAHVKRLDFQGLLDLTTAFGCGRGRMVPRDTRPGDWSGRWDRAMTRLGALIERMCDATINQLARIGVQIPGALPDPAGAASLVLHVLVDPVATLGEALVVIKRQSDETTITLGGVPLQALRIGARLVLEITDAARIDGPAGPDRHWPFIAQRASKLNVLTGIDETHIRYEPIDPNPGWEVKLDSDEWLSLAPVAQLWRYACGCGQRECAVRHRLEGWSPDDEDLEQFLRRAVSGVASPHMKAGNAKELAVSMLGACWANVDIGVLGMARLVLQPLEHNFCVTCADGGARDPAFLGARCPACGEPHRPQDPTVARHRLLLLDTEPPLYERQPRWACLGCQPVLLHAKPGRCPRATVEGGQLRRCLACAPRSGSPIGGELSARPTFVWVP